MKVNNINIKSIKAGNLISTFQHLTFRLRYWILIYALLFIELIPAKAQEDNPLSSYLELAAENNPQLKSSFNEYLAALEEVPQVGALQDPQLMFGYFIKPVETRVGAQRFSFSATQAFPWFGTLEAKEDVATQQAKAKFEMFQDQKLKLFNEVRSTYNNMYYIQKAMKVTNENLELLSSFKELARINFEGGNSGFSNILKVEMEEEVLQNQLNYLQDKMEPLMVKFESLLNTGLEDSISFPEVLWIEQIQENKETIYQTILAQNPNIEKLNREMEAFDKQMAVARKEGMPSFTLGFNYVNVDARNNLEIPQSGQDAFMFPQVGIKIPLFRDKYRSMVKEAGLKKESVAFQKENLMNEFNTRLEEIYADYQDAVRDVNLYTELIDLAQRSLDLLQSEFSTGKTDFQELLDMERQLLNYELKLEKARAERNTLVYHIDYLQGEDIIEADRN